MTARDTAHTAAQQDAQSGRWVVISVQGMKCGNCRRKVTDLLQAAPGVDRDSVEVDLQQGEARFRLMPNNVQHADAPDTVRAAMDAVAHANFTVSLKGDGASPPSAPHARSQQQQQQQRDDDGGAAVHEDQRQDLLLDNVAFDLPVSTDPPTGQDGSGQPAAGRSLADGPPLFLPHTASYTAKSDLLPLVDQSQENIAAAVQEPGALLEMDLGGDAEIDISHLGSHVVGTFRITGMSCSSCVSKVEDVATGVDGVVSASVNLVTNTATVLYRASEGIADQIVRTIGDIGYECELMSETPHGAGASVEPGAADETSNLTLDIEGMTCASCVATIEDHVSRLAGVDSVTANLVTKTCTVTYDPNVTGARDIVDQILGIGFMATVRTESDMTADDAARASNREISLWRRRMLVSVVLGVPLFVISMVDMLLMDHSTRALGVRTVDWLIFAMSAPVYLYGGWHFHSRSLLALRHGYADMSVLISVSTTAAFVYSALIVIGNVLFGVTITEFFFETAAMIIAFQNVGKYLEAVAKKRTSHALAELLQLQARSAVLLVPRHRADASDYASAAATVADADADSNSDYDYDEREIAIELLQRGDLVKVLPGEKIPTDGVVVSGTSTVNESMITGESCSVLKEVGSSVIGGTINEEGALVVRATRVGRDTMLAQIMRLVQEAQSSKPRVQRFDDALSRVFVPFIGLLAGLVFVWWFSISVVGIVPDHWIPAGYSSFLFSLLFSMAVLAIACPCALGLATPTAIMVGSGVGAKHGVLFKSGEAFETLTQVDYVVFDKTGTLTEGKPSVVHAEPLVGDDGASADEALVAMWNHVGTAESGSEHPLGRSLYQYAKEFCRRRHVPLMSSTAPMGALTFTAIPGRGISCVVPAQPGAGRERDVRIYVGKRDFVEQSTGMQVPAHSAIIDRMRGEELHGRTVVWCGADERVLGFVSLFDVLKPDARRVIRMLNELRIQTCIASGDRRMPVQTVARKLGIQRALCECLPHQKLREIKRLQRSGFTVALVGDGINDSPSLAKADVGIAIGAGAEVAIQSADVVLVRSDLGSLVTAIDLARKVYSRIKLNHVWALGYNVVLVPLAAGVVYPLFKVQVPPMLAAVCMMASSLMVLGSSLHLNTYRTPFRVHQARQNKRRRQQRRRALRRDSLL